MKGFLLGSAVGFFAAAWMLRRVGLESSCCQRVAAGARERAVDTFGTWAGLAGDSVGLWDRAPQLLDLFGVDA